LIHYTHRAGLDQFTDIISSVFFGAGIIINRHYGFSKKAQQVTLLNHVEPTDNFFPARASVIFLDLMIHELYETESWNIFIVHYMELPRMEPI
jgi:hypothetical protein